MSTSILKFINSLCPCGMPPHKLSLKENNIVMLVRNLDLTNGHCNGTRHIIQHLHQHVIGAVIECGPGTSSSTYINMSLVLSSNVDQAHHPAPTSTCHWCCHRMWTRHIIQHLHQHVIDAVIECGPGTSSSTYINMSLVLSSNVDQAHHPAPTSTCHWCCHRMWTTCIEENSQP